MSRTFAFHSTCSLTLPFVSFVPVNIPLRDYQLSITRTALFANTLVALPTGLGKTLIAAVVMYNFFRWFPEGIVIMYTTTELTKCYSCMPSQLNQFCQLSCAGKIVFAAPSRPLVMQQIEACHNTVGIPQVSLRNNIHVLTFLMSCIGTSLIKVFISTDLRSGLLT